jgi:phosphonoacetate hydrolase
MVTSSRKRIVVMILDGFGPEYLQASDMPNLRAMIQGGLHRTVTACLPSVTNVNTAAIATGAWPSAHGITANSYFDQESREEHYMDRAEMLLVPTIFERVRQAGGRSALLTAKVKTIRLLHRGADVLLAAEDPPREWVTRLGPPPEIYSAEINLWLLDALQVLLRRQPDLGLVCCHTTDYPMHMSDPRGELSQNHLREVDVRLGRILDENPDLECYLTADHGMNFKRRCYDLNKYLPANACPIFFAMSAERDPYIKHHRTLGGAAYVWLNRTKDVERAADVLRRTDGVEAVYRRRQAASRFQLHPDRIGDLLVLGDETTVFGPLSGPVEELPPDFRTHGSRHELQVPLVIYGAKRASTSAGSYTQNLDATRWISFGE